MIDLRAQFEVKAADCWIGVFWRSQPHQPRRTGCFRCWDNAAQFALFTDWDVWVCLLPMLPLHLSWTTVRTAWGTQPQAVRRVS